MPGKVAIVISAPMPSAPAFPPDIEVALATVRERCAAIIDAVCGSGARAKDVSDAFGVHAKLGWQMWNVANSHPLAAVRFLPNEHGLNVWTQAAAARGVPAALIAELEQAMQAVRGVIELHAEDREMFEMLLDAQAGALTEEAEVRWRKQAFMGNSFSFGARARCMLATAILYPSGEDRFSIVRILGLLGLVRTRVGIRWPFGSLVVQRHGKGSAPAREPLVPSDSPLPLLSAYCSQPLPAVERTQDGDTLRDELLPGVVGETGAATVFTGEILHDVGPSRGSRIGEVAHFGTSVRTPTELLVSDHIVHRSLFPQAQRELRVYSELVSPTTRDERDRLEVSETLQHLGRGLLRVRTADVPGYAELLAEAFERIGQDPDEFDVFRTRLRYPPMPASVMVRHELSPPTE
jgi:hypothetical protein